MREFADEYLRRCNPHWKPSGRKTVRNYVKSRILPTFGKMPLDRIGPEDVAAWFDAASKDRPGAANRAFEILRSMMFRAEEWGLRERGTNPCLGIKKNPRNCIARFLDADELARHRRRRHQSAGLQDRAARGAARRSRPGGHRRHRTTAGYAHLADAHLVEAAEKVGTIIANAMADVGSDSSVKAAE